MGPFQPPKGQNNNKNAATFFFLTLVVFALPLLLPSNPSPTYRPAVAATATPFSQTPSAPNSEHSVELSPTSSSSPSAKTEHSTATPQASSLTPTPKPDPGQAKANSTPSASATATANATPTPEARTTPSSGGPSPNASPSSPPEIDWQSEPGPNLDFKAKLQKIITNLLLITALVFITAKILQKYYVSGGFGRTAKKPLMEVLATTQIGPSANLCLVQVCNKTMVLAMTEHSVTTVCEITQEELEIARQADPTEAASTTVPPLTKAPSQVYGDILRHYLSIIPGFGEKK